MPFSASLYGKCFSPHFPQTENGRGFDSLCHIKRGAYTIQIFGSSGKCVLFVMKGHEFQFEELHVSVAIGLAFHGLSFVVESLQRSV